MPSRATRRTWMGVAVIVMVGGCASVPTSGSVHVGRTVPGVSGLDSRDYRAFPSGPVSGESPTGLLTGYLDALVDNDGNFATARAFLAAGTSWNSTSRTTLYDGKSEEVRRTSANRVMVSMDRVGVINSRGRYTVRPGHIDVPFRITRHGGEWRIAHLPSGVLLSTSDAVRTLEPLEVFYLNAARARLIPVPILVQPDQPGLATTVIQALLAGPGQGEGPAIVSAAPHGVGLLGNVPVGTDGVAEVNLSGGVREVSAADLQRLSAQIVWTLRQVPTVTSVRLLENGTPLTGVGVGPVQSIDTWRQYSPETTPVSHGALASHDGVVVGVGRSAPSSLAARAITSPVVSADGQIVAGLQLQVGRATLVVGTPTTRPHSRLSAPTLASPAVTPVGDVLVLDGAGAKASIVDVPTTGIPQPVVMREALRRHGISSIAVSRDGSRIAMVLGPIGHRELIIGSLSMTHPAPTVSGTAVVLPASRDVSAVAWEGASEIVAIGLGGDGRRAVIRTSTDGYQPRVLTSVGLPAAPTSVAAAPDQPVLVGAAGSIWSLTSGRWQRVSPGIEPSYAG